MTTSQIRRGSKVTGSPDILAHIPLDRDASTPLYQQIYEGVRRAILDGSLRPGQRVPSTRALALELHVSRLPVLTAYEQLLHEGYLDGHVGSGTFVSASLPDDSIHSVPAGVRRGAASRASIAIPPAEDDGGRRPFRLSLPALDAFPQALWARLVSRHAHAMTPAVMAYGNPAGLDQLRAAIAQHLRTARAVRCEAEQVLIVSGSQAALQICATVLLGRDDCAVVEEPGYEGARAALGSNGATLIPVGVDDEGIDVNEMDKLSVRVRAAYVTPSHQYPLGASMSASRRLALIDWARRNDAWLIEDDYDSDYRYVSRPLGALQGMDTRGRVVYVGTFSKVLFPALRVGYIVVPPELWNEFIDARSALDLFSPTLYQLVLADFLREGHFARHLRRMRKVYAGRRDALLSGLAQHCNGLLAVHNADAGLHVSTLLPAGVDDVAIVNIMNERGLTATALSSCYVGKPGRSGLLLGFGGWDERRILGATQLLGEILREVFAERSA